MVNVMKKFKYVCVFFVVLVTLFCNTFSFSVLAGGSHENYVYYHLGEGFRYVDTNSTPSSIELPRDTTLSLGVRYEDNYISDLKVESDSADVIIGEIENETMLIGEHTASYCGVKLIFNGIVGSTVKLHMTYTITDQYDDPMNFSYDIIVTVTEKIKEHSYTKYVSNGNGTHKVVCEDCDAVQPEHESDSCSGGTATCTSKAKCSFCEAEYGELGVHDYSAEWSSDGINHWHVCNVCNARKDSATHILKTTTTKATTSKDGKKETKCSVCGEVAKTTTIYAAKIIKLNATTYSYDGKSKKPSVTVKDSKGNAIASTNYTVIAPSEKKNVGKYTIKVIFKGDYSGTKNLTFKINPPKITFDKVTSGKTSFTVKWSQKTTNVTGYEIQYSTSSSFKRGNKKVKVASAKTVSKTIKNLKAKQKYYVRIRTYKIVGKTPYYSGWSANSVIVI